MTDMEASVHQLPTDCYPPTDSDDESFVVLERCIDSPDSPSDEPLTYGLLSSDVIDQSLDLTSDAINNCMKLNSSANSLRNLKSLQSIVSSMSSDDVQQNVESLIEENMKLKETLRQNNLTMKNQYDTLITWQKNVEKVHDSHKQKFSDTKVYIKKLQVENSRLNSLLHVKSMDKLSSEASSMSIINMEDHKSTILDLEKKLSEKNDCLNEIKEKISAIELNYDEKEQKYLEQITALKVANENCKTVQLEEKEHTDKLQTQLSAAQASIIELRQQIKAIESTSDLYKEELSKNEALAQKNLNLHDMNDVAQKQIEVIKKDFETEKKEKVALFEEVMNLRADLHRIQRRNEDLLSEISILRETTQQPAQNVVPTATGQAQVEPSAPPSPPPINYTCPICNSNYRSMRALETHVELCLEQN